MGGPASPSVFHTTPPQPARKARSTLVLRSVGGAEASQNGLGDLTPTKLVRRSTIYFPSPQRRDDRARRALAVLDRAHGQIEPAGDAIAARPDFGETGAALRVDGDL